MLTHLRKRLATRIEDGDEGFTLIELMVVLLVMGILLAIAIPTYLSVTSSANTTAAQSNLSTALTAAKAYYISNNQLYTGILSSGPSGASGGSGLSGTGLTFIAGATASTQPSVVSVDTPGTAGVVLVMAAKSTNGNCYAVADVEQSNPGGTFLASSQAGVYYGDFTGSCSAQTAESSINNWSTLTSQGW